MCRRLGLRGVSARGALGLQAHPPAACPRPRALRGLGSIQCATGASLAPAGWGPGTLPAWVSEHWVRGAFPPSPWWAGQGHRDGRAAQAFSGL